MADTNRILASFTTDNPRPLIVINGVRYEVAQRDDLGLAAYVRVQALKSNVYQGLIDSAGEGGAMTEEQAADFLHMLDEFVRIVLLDCPDEVIDKLKDMQKLRICELFKSELEMQPQTTAPNRAAARAASRTSTTSSRRSRASTEGRRTTG